MRADVVQLTRELKRATFWNLLNGIMRAEAIKLTINLERAEEPNLFKLNLRAINGQAIQ